MKMYERTCVICGKKFMAAREIRLTCSYECKKVRDKQVTQAHHVKRLEEERTCPICGTKFRSSGVQVYCSNECRKIHNKQIQKIKPREPMEELKSIAKEARKLNLSYGEYVARYKA